MRAAPAIALALAACDATPAAPPCERSLEGIWRSDERIGDEVIGYHFLERDRSIEGFPTFRDVPADLPPGVRAAPASIDLVRMKGEPGGRWSRRYELGGQRCVVSAPVRAQRCEGRELVLELGRIDPPADWSACPPPRDAQAMLSAPMTQPSRTLRLVRASR